MAFVGGERPFSIPAAVLAAVIGAGVVAVASDTRGVPLETLAATHGLVATRDAATGIVTLRGPRGDVRLAPGIAIAAVNGAPVPLDHPAWVRAGRLFVDAAFADALGGLLAAAGTGTPAGEAGSTSAPITTVASAPAPPPPVETLAGRPRRRVVLDAGHGGKFDGTVGPTGLREKELTLALALALGERLAAMGIEVVQTRRSDCSLSEDWSEDLDLRVAIADRAQADLLVSLHFNAEPTGGVQGFELHLPHGGGGGEGAATGAMVPQVAAARDDGLRAAQAIRSALRDALDTPDRGLKFGRKRVVWRAALPAVLIEYAFLSHPATERRYRDAAALATLADATARGIGHFLAGRPAIAAAPAGGAVARAQ